MIAYTSRCSGRTARDLRDAGWRFLLLPGSRPRRPFAGMGWAIDNGAWTAHTSQSPWDERGFVELIDEWGSGADWIAAPDIVAGGADSLALSVSWLARLTPIAPVLIPVQDGMVPDDLAPHVGPRVGLFVGGTTEWKEATMRQWGALARAVGCWLHVARVNTVRRIVLCQDAGADSFDGTSPVRFRKTLPKLDGARRQVCMEELWTKV